MIEAPEALILSEQLNQTIKGKRISFVSAGYTPHKFVWYYGDPAGYSEKLLHKTVGEVFYRIFSSGLVSILKHASAHYRINRKTLCFIALKIRFRIFI